MIPTHLADFNQSCRCRHLFTFFEQEDIARHHVKSSNLMRLSTPQDPDCHRQQATQGLHGALGFEYLDKAKDGVEDNHTEDYAAEGRQPFPWFEGLREKGEASCNPE